MSQITVQVSDAFRELGYSDEEIRREVPVLLVLKRFRQGLISSGKAARIPRRYGFRIWGHPTP